MKARRTGQVRPDAEFDDGLEANAELLGCLLSVDPRWTYVALFYLGGLVTSVDRVEDMSEFTDH